MAFDTPVVGTTSGQQGNGSPSVPLPGSGLTDDVTLMVMFCYSRATAATFSTPTGWTQIDSTQQTSGGTLAFFYRVYQTGDTAPTCTVGGQGANDIAVLYIVGVDGADTADPIFALTVSTNGSQTDAGPFTGDTTPSTADSLCYFGFGRRDDWGGGSSVDTLTGDLSWTELVEVRNLNGDDCGVVLDYGIDEAGNTTISDKTFNVTGTTSAEAAGFCLILNGTESLGGGSAGPTFRINSIL